MIPVPQLLPALVNQQGNTSLSRELLLGDVDYDSGSDEEIQAPQKKKRPRRRDSDGKVFAPLAATAGEIATIAEIFREVFDHDADDIEALKGPLATEAQFRELAPQFFHLHLATHGFFAPANQKSALSAAMMRGAAQRATLASRDTDVTGMNPGLMSGLAFAGANLEPEPGNDDGILTAKEIAFLSLDGVGKRRTPRSRHRQRNRDTPTDRRES